MCLGSGLNHLFQGCRQGIVRQAFAGDPLSSVVADISRYTDIQFDFASSDLADMRVGGVFGLGEVDDMLEALETNFGVRAERIDDKHVRIVRKDP